ncbi:MAG: serine hydrolase domain-containing protein [bacterium]|nr:class A beta-lactamase-related serine hydrolase [Gammaproteobacteria bacterium]HIL95770.1 class A beta-lactamase-related serine hydrolase [Pseudomonadales bacterium]
MAIEVTETGLDFTELHERMQWYVDEEIIPCCNTLIMQGTDVVDVKTYGPLDHETNRPLPENAIFRMHSSTKLATSIAAMMLFDEGKFQLDDPLENYLPEFSDMRVLKADADNIDDVEPVHDAIRINQILSHSAGLSYGFIEPESIIDKAYIASGVNPLAVPGGTTLESLCQGVAELPLAYQPGSFWRYSLGTDVTARLVEVLSGMRFDTFLKERIFNPLGMVDTDFHVPKEKQDRFTTMYLPTNPLDPMASGYTKADDPYEGANSQPTTFLSGGGGLMSTLGDYLAFVQMLVNGGEWRGHRLVKTETLDLMRTNQLAKGVGVNFPFWEIPATRFGLGFALKEAPAEGEPDSAVGEYHWGGMAGTHIWMSPKANIAGICMTQRMPAFWHPFSHDFKRLAYKIGG